MWKFFLNNNKLESFQISSIINYILNFIQVHFNLLYLVTLIALIFIPTMPSSPWNRTAIPCFSFAQFAFDTTSQLLLKIESKYVALVNFTY